ncbi:MAG: sulfurtransferase [Phycisphaerales bacterium]|nr:MAG: sulfurtransferase [Phycisphaerales bacterium]
MPGPLDNRGLHPDYRLKEAFEVSPAQAKALVDEGKAVVLDCRTDEELEVASVPGALHIPLHELDTRWQEIKADPDAVILTLCHHGRRSFRAATALQAKGFTNTRSIAGGIENWSLAIDPTVPRYTNDQCGPQRIE